MTRWPYIVIALVCLITIGGTPALAQIACGERTGMIAGLDRTYGESRRGGGLAGQAIVEVWASCKTGTWTILKTTPNGWCCVMASGQGWHDEGCRPGRSS